MPVYLMLWCMVVFAVLAVFLKDALLSVLSLGALSALLLMLGLPGDTWLRLGIWLIIGLAIYFFYGMRHSKVGNDETAAAA